MIITKPQKRTILFAHGTDKFEVTRTKSFHLYFPEFMFELITIEFGYQCREFYLKTTTVDGKQLLPLPNYTKRNFICLGKTYYQERDTEIKLWQRKDFVKLNFTITDVLNDYIQSFWQTTFCTVVGYDRWLAFFIKWERKQYNNWDDIIRLHHDNCN